VRSPNEIRDRNMSNVARILGLGLFGLLIGLFASGSFDKTIRIWEQPDIFQARPTIPFFVADRGPMVDLVGCRFLREPRASGHGATFGEVPYVVPVGEKGERHIGVDCFLSETANASRRLSPDWRACQHAHSGHCR
jgi:hypothetical protein